MSIIRWRPITGGLRPFRPFQEMENEMENVFKNFFGTTTAEHWAPSVDVIDKKDKLLVKATLPGIKKEDIKLSLEDNVLTLEGERKYEKDHDASNYYHCETCYGKFYRSMTLPVEVQSQGIEAMYKDGILEIQIPKAEKVLPKVIDIKVG